MIGGFDILHLRYLAKAIFLYAWMFLGPLCLLVGPIVFIRARFRTAASALLAVGCLILSIGVGWILLSLIHDLSDPLIARPPYNLYAAGLTLTVLADICAVLLIRDKPAC
jgi:hypothetical protein